MTKDEIKDAPDYDDERHRIDEPAYHEEVGEVLRPLGRFPADGTVALTRYSVAAGGVERRSGIDLGAVGSTDADLEVQVVEPVGVAGVVHQLDHLARGHLARGVLERRPGTRVRCV